MPAVKHSDERKNADIIDIRGDTGEIDLKNEVVKLLNPESGIRKLPTLLLYDEKGLQLFEDITYLEEYYPTNHEIEVLQASAKDMASKISTGSMIIELGSGNLRKTNLLLQAFDDAGKDVEYYALDLSLRELERTLAELPAYKHVSCHGLWGTYDDGKEWLQGIEGKPKAILHMGSSIGNFQRDEAAEFLAGFASILKAQDTMLVGVDSCMKPDKVYHAYNDSQGITHQFILNGLSHANQIFNEDVFDVDSWKVIGEYIYDEDGGRHQAFVTPTRDVTILGQHIKALERIKIEESLKYSPSGAKKLWESAGLERVRMWNRNDEYGIHQLQPKFSFPLTPELYAATPLPSIPDWQSIWRTWDIVTRQMLPDQELNEKPIKLRNACIFYLGHIPTFLDIQLTKTTGDPATHPAKYWNIFERGVDPDVDDPSRCHDHSEVPDSWPPVTDILAYQDRVRMRLLGLYKDGQEKIPRSVARAIWLGFEHELMHLETLLYMMLQSPKTLPPPHRAQPDFEKMAKEARAKRVPNEWFNVPEQTVIIGMDDPEDASEGGNFGWDNEKPARKEKVHAFQAKGRPITNEEYAHYLKEIGDTEIPASWMKTRDSATANGHTNGDSHLNDISVRTVYGPVPLKHALDWPVFASYDELSGCAAWMGGRIPTFEEAKSIYSFAETQRNKDLLRSKLAANIPAVNGHLVNDGVEETPPSRPTDPQADEQPPLFVDLSPTNTSFASWHPVPVTHRGNHLSGQGDMGGVWEWTSSALTQHEGFQPMELYPGYTADFFDGKHNVVLGGSWATHPRIAGRRSFVNWYQRKYPYAWVGARVVRDVE